MGYFNGPHEKIAINRGSADLNEGRMRNFDEWNMQFSDNKNLDDYIPEYNMTLREYQKNINPDN